MMTLLGMGMVGKAQDLPIRADYQLDKTVFSVPSTPHKKVVVNIPDVGYVISATTDVCGLATVKLPSLFKLSYDGVTHRVEIENVGWISYSTTDGYNKDLSDRPKCIWNGSRWLMDTRWINWWDESQGITYKLWRKDNELIFWKSDVPPGTKLQFLVYTWEWYVYGITKTIKSDACGIAKLNDYYPEYYARTDKNGYSYFEITEVDGKPLNNVIDGKYMCRQGRFYAPR
jgi:hypothetical protein